MAERISPQRASRRNRSLMLPILIILVGMSGVIPLGHWLEKRKPGQFPTSDQESLYLSGSTLRNLSLGFNGLVADWYWMKSLQYVGRKVLNYDKPLQMDDLSELKLVQLYSLLDQTTTIDPAFLEAYKYGAVVLPAVNKEQAIKLLEKGIAANPTAWILYHHLGYIYWQQGDFSRSSELYQRASTLPGAPEWLGAMSARMAAEGGSRDTARRMYEQIRDETGDQNIKIMAERRLLQITSFDQRDEIRKALSIFRQRSGRCPTTWRELAPYIRESDLALEANTLAPVDPAGTPYRLVDGGCEVDLDPVSIVPYK
jgi:tetratricopeptide (TPR) repeat protein